jgi:hypothetical protein
VAGTGRGGGRQHETRQPTRHDTTLHILGCQCALLCSVLLPIPSPEQTRVPSPSLSPALCPALSAQRVRNAIWLTPRRSLPFHSASLTEMVCVSQQYTLNLYTVYVTLHLICTPPSLPLSLSHTSSMVVHLNHLTYPATPPL